MKKIIYLIAAIIAVFLIVAAMQPDDFRVTRSVTLAATPSAVFEQVNDLQRWQDWSPWAKLDPTATNTFEGSTVGTGASMHWAGDHNVGEGRMTITESRANEFVQFQLDFIKPFAATNTAEFTLKPEGNRTLVTWSMYGKKNFIAKAIGLVINCEKMVGGQFEEGLANLKSVVETNR